MRNKVETLKILPFREVLLNISERLLDGFRVIANYFSYQVLNETEQFCSLDMSLQSETFPSSNGRTDREKYSKH